MIKDRLIFECRTVSPLFSNGTDDQAPELRSNSVKGMLRYWWRAINFDLRLSEMKTAEQAIFGGSGDNDKTGRKSSVFVDIYPLEEAALEENYQLPHEDRKLTLGFAVGSPLAIELSLLRNPVKGRPKDREVVLMNPDKLKALAILWLCLGGLGRRTRRGMGAIAIEKINGQDFVLPADEKQLLSFLCTCLNVVPVSPTGKVKKLFEAVQNPSRIQIAQAFRNSRKERYPYIREVRLGAPFESGEKLLSHVVGTGSDLRHDPAFPRSLGGISPRFASPVYVSSIDGMLPVITTLHAVSKDGPPEEELREGFKNNILVP